MDSAIVNIGEDVQGINKPLERIEAESLIECLCKGGFVVLDDDRLQSIKKLYYEGEPGRVVIFQPPDLGKEILLLEHFVSDRYLSANTNFCMEVGFDRQCVVYRVEEHIIRNGDFYCGDNDVVLSYSVLHGPRCERRVKFKFFFCGLYYPLVLTEEMKGITNQFREIINDQFSIRRI